MIRTAGLLVLMVLALESRAAGALIIDGQTLEGRPMKQVFEQAENPSLLVAWASWCGLCRQEVPAIESLRHEIGPSLQVIGINVDLDPARGLEAQQKLGISYPSWSDPRLEISDSLGIRGTPGLVLLDRSGQVRARSKHLSKRFMRQIKELVTDR